jgi:hypothetical protein
MTELQRYLKDPGLIFMQGAGWIGALALFNITPTWQMAGEFAMASVVAYIAVALMGLWRES